MNETERHRGSRDERLADRAPGSVDDVEDPVRDAGILGEPCEGDRRERREARGLQDYRVPGRERGDDRPHREEERVVPRGDVDGDAERLADRVIEPAPRDGDRLALDLVGKARDVLEGPDDEADVDARLAERLPHVQRFESGEHLLPLLEEAGEREERLGPSGPVVRGPVRFAERGLGDLHRVMGVGRVGDRDLGERLVGRRVQDLRVSPRLPGTSRPPITSP